MTIEVIAVALIMFAPALLFLGWLTVIGALVSALGTTSDRDLDELRLLRPAARPS